MVTVNSLLTRNKFLEGVRRNGEYHITFLKKYELDYTSIKEEYQNILANLDWSFRIENWEIVIEGTYLLYGYWREQGYWNDAIHYLKLAYEASLRSNNLVAQARVSNDLGIFYRIQGNLQLSLDCFRTTLVCWQKIGNSSGIASAYGNLGLVSTMRGERKNALDFYFKSLEISEAIGDDSRSAKQYDNLSRLYTDIGEWKKAQYYLLKSHKIYNRLNDTPGIGRVHINLGIVYYELCEWQKALRYFEKAGKIFDKLQERHLLAMVYENKGCVYSLIGQVQDDWQKARGLLQDAIIYYKQLGEATQGLAGAYIALSSLYLNMGEWENALVCQQNAKVVIDKQGPVSSNSVEPQLCNATILLEMGQWEEAYFLYEEARPSLELKEDRLALIRLYSGLSEAFLNSGKLESAIYYAHQSLERAKGPGDVYYQGIALAYRTLAKVYQGQGENEKAILFFVDSLNLYHRLGLRYEVGRTYFEMGVRGMLWKEGMARSYLEKSHNIFERLGAKVAIEKVNRIK